MPTAIKTNYYRIFDINKRYTEFKALMNDIFFLPSLGFLTFENRNSFVSFDNFIVDSDIDNYGLNTLRSILSQLHYESEICNYGISNKRHFKRDDRFQFFVNQAMDNISEAEFQSLFDELKIPKEDCDINKLLKSIFDGVFIRFDKSEYFLEHLEQIEDLLPIITYLNNAFLTGRNVTLFQPLVLELTKKKEQNIKRFRTDKGIVFVIGDYYYFEEDDFLQIKTIKPKDVHKEFLFMKEIKLELTLDYINESLKEKVITRTSAHYNSGSFRVENLRNVIDGDWRLLSVFSLEEVIESIDKTKLSTFANEHFETIVDFLYKERDLDYKILHETGVYIHDLFYKENSFIILDASLFFINFKDSHYRLPKNSQSYFSLYDVRFQEFLDQFNQFKNADKEDNVRVVFNQDHDFVLEGINYNPVFPCRGKFENEIILSLSLHNC